MKIRYRNIAIEGNIGAGKSTLARALAKRLHALFVGERFENNPFLEPFYKDAKQNAFRAEMFFLEDRFRQMKEALAEDQCIVSDYYWDKSLVFARINLKGEELQLFERLFYTLKDKLPSPDIILYLHRKPETLQENINLRGRKYEKSIRKSYLEKLTRGYSTYLTQLKNVPVLVIESANDKAIPVEAILALLYRPHKKGITPCSIEF